MEKSHENDRVTVIRCKECKHWHHIINNKYYCEYRYLPSAEEDFCSFAERKEENDKQ